MQDFAEVGWVEQCAEERFVEFVDNVRVNNSAGYFIPEDEGIFLQDIIYSVVPEG